MRQLESLEAVAALGLLPHDVQNRVDELGPLGVVALGPVVAGAALAKHKVIRPEYLAERSRTYRIHRAGFKIDQDRARHVLATGRLIVIHVYPLQLQVRVTVISARGIDPVLVRDHLPKLQASTVF